MTLDFVSKEENRRTDGKYDYQVRSENSKILAEIDPFITRVFEGKNDIIARGFHRKMGKLRNNFTMVPGLKTDTLITRVPWLKQTQS